jgi:energy-coupling factor transporter ATP-binding protein EcfA2
VTWPKPQALRQTCGSDVGVTALSLSSVLTEREVGSPRSPPLRLRVPDCNLPSRHNGLIYRTIPTTVFTRVAVRNLKAIQDLDLAFGKITLIIGENGTGKSTILQALSLVKASRHGQGLQTNLPYANLGLITDLVRTGNACDIEFEGTGTVPPGPMKWQSASFRCRISFDANGLRAYRTELKVLDGPTVSNNWIRYGPMVVEPQQLTFGPLTFQLAGTNSIGMLFAVGAFQAPDNSTETRTRAGSINAQLQNVAATVVAALDGFHVVAPMRGLTEPTYPLQSQPVVEYTPRSGTAQTGAALATNLTYNRKNTSKVSEWEKAIVGVSVHAELGPGPQVVIQNPDKGINFVNEGFGSNQLLFILERLANLPSGSTVAIEEPEIHLHPKAQFELGKTLVKIAGEASDQIIVTTHSPDFIAGVLTGVRQGVIPPDDVAIWYLELKQGNIVATKSEVSKSGSIKGPALASFVEASMNQVSEFFASP